MATSPHIANPRLLRPYGTPGDVQSAVTLHEEMVLVRDFTAVPTSHAKKVQGQPAEGGEKNKFILSGAAKSQ